MKSFLKLPIMAMAAGLMLASCSKSSDKAVTPTNSLPDPVNNIVSKAILDTLQAHGTVINKGTTPPVLNGIYLLHPDICSFDNSPGKLTGATFDDYRYKFSNQNSTAFSVRVDYADIYDNFALTDSTSTFISGSGNFFSVFSKVNGARQGVNYVILHVLSGEVASGGIKNFQNSTYLVSKGSDPNQLVEPAGTTRVFYDSDKFSETQSILITPSAIIQHPLKTAFIAHN